MIGTTHEYQLLILEHHLDTFGHVNNAVYLQLFEQARWDLITRNGYGLADVHRLQIGLTILEVQVRFARELHARMAQGTRVGSGGPHVPSVSAAEMPHSCPRATLD